MGKKWPVNLACDSDSYVNRKCATWERWLYFHPKEGMLWIFSTEKSDGFGRV
jgi:hypothetical protein